ncbi:MAG: HAD family hydrolase [Gaiellaceae bacterium]
MLEVPHTVLFDLRGTLIDPSTGWKLTDEQRIRFLRAGGARVSEVQLRVTLGRAIADVNALTFRRREYFEQDRLVLERAAALSGLEVPAAKLDAFEGWRNRAFARAVRAFPDAEPTLRQLRARGVAVGCVADGGREWTRRLLARAGLLALLDVVVASEESGEVKATGVALRLACARLHAEPARVLFVGERLDKDVEMAEAAGAQALLLDRPGRRLDRSKTISSLTEILDRPLAAREEEAWRKTATT